MARDTVIVISHDGVDYELRVFDGERENFTFTPREWGVLEDVAGVLPGNFEEKLRMLSQRLMVALLVIAMRRRGIKADPERLLDAPGLLTPRDQEGEASPPDEAAGEAA